MTGILIAELLIVGQQGGRLSWPYGDLTPGNYLAKACLPIFCVLIALAVANRGKLSSTAAVYALIRYLYFFNFSVLLFGETT